MYSWNDIDERKVSMDMMYSGKIECFRIQLMMHYFGNANSRARLTWIYNEWMPTLYKEQRLTVFEFVTKYKLAMKLVQPTEDLL